MADPVAVGSIDGRAGGRRRLERSGVDDDLGRRFWAEEHVAAWQACQVGARERNAVALVWRVVRRPAGQVHQFTSEGPLAVLCLREWRSGSLLPSHQGRPRPWLARHP